MGPMLASLLRLQAIEHDLAHVRRRLRSKQNAIGAMKRKVDDLNAQKALMHEQVRHRQAEAGKFELELKSREQDIARLRTQLNSAKTNKEYAAILTQINTIKADNSKLEDEILKVMQGVDAVKGESDKIDAQIETEQKRFQEVSATSAEEVRKLESLQKDLQAKRDAATKGIAPDALALFDRIAAGHDGEAMAAVEVADAKRGEYTCGGCYMSLTAEHYSALLVRDELRRCDNCGRILYVEQSEPQRSR